MVYLFIIIFFIKNINFLVLLYNSAQKEEKLTVQHLMTAIVSSIYQGEAKKVKFIFSSRYSAKKLQLVNIKKQKKNYLNRTVSSNRANRLNI